MPLVYNQPRDPQSIAPDIITTKVEESSAAYQGQQFDSKPSAAMVPPEAASQARSVPEDDFLRKVGLDANNSSHVQVYNTMMVGIATGNSRQ